MRKKGDLLFYIFMILFSASNLPAQGTKPGVPPPAAVVVSEVRTGTAAYGGIYGARSGIIDSQTYVGGWPELKTYDVPKD